MSSYPHLSSRAIWRKIWSKILSMMRRSMRKTTKSMKWKISRCKSTTRKKVITRNKRLSLKTTSMIRRSRRQPTAKKTLMRLSRPPPSTT